jgi:hypothetical protein
MALMRPLVLLCIAGVAGAQTPPAIKLAPAESKLEQEFSSIIGARELADGRLLVSDATEQKILIVDFRGKTATQVGKNGQGPGEYQIPERFWAIGGDSSLMIERRTSRWHLFKGAELVKTLPADDPTVAALRRLANGADGRGNVIRVAAFTDEKSAAGRAMAAGNGPESSYVLRANRRTGKVDTVAWIKNPKSEITTTTNARGEITSVSVQRVPFGSGEEVALFEDGWLAIARLDPYRVDWISPAGQMTKGARLPWQGTRVTDADVVAWLTQGGRGQPVTDAIKERAAGWMPKVPTTVPALTLDGVRAMEGGQLLVRHPATAAQPEAHYDVVDRSGKIRGTIAMPKGESILAVSKKWAYVVYVDDDGLNFLRRHPWSDRSVSP